MSDRITIQELRAEGYCVRGMREVANRHGIDFRKFVREGISFEEAEKLDEVVLNNMIAKKRGQNNG